MLIFLINSNCIILLKSDGHHCKVEESTGPLIRGAKLHGILKHFLIGGLNIGGASGGVNNPLGGRHSPEQRLRFLQLNTTTTATTTSFNVLSWN